MTVDLHGFADAHEWMRFAEAMVRRTGGSGGVQVDLWVQIALVYFRESRYPEAEAAARKAIALAAQTPSENPLQRAAAYRTLGDVLKYEGRYDEGLHLLDQARVLTESVLGPEHPEVAVDPAQGGRRLRHEARRRGGAGARAARAGAACRRACRPST